MGAGPSQGEAGWLGREGRVPGVTPKANSKGTRLAARLQVPTAGETEKNPEYAHVRTRACKTHTTHK